MDNDIFKKNVITKGYHSYQNYQLVTKVNAVDTKILFTSRLVTKHTIIQIKKIEDVDRKIPNIDGLVKKTDYNTTLAEIENKIPSITDREHC